MNTEHLDDAVHGRVGVRVQLDEGVGAVGEPVDLTRCRERRLVDEGEILVAGDRLVGIISLKDLLNFLHLKIELEGPDGEEFRAPTWGHASEQRKTLTPR